MTTSPVMEWLGRGLPLTLLLDLADADGPDSAGILAAEPAPADPVWAQAAVPRHERLAQLKIVV